MKIAVLILSLQGRKRKKGYERTRSLILFPLLTGDGKRKVKEKSHPLSHSSVTSAISVEEKKLHHTIPLSPRFQPKGT